MKISKNLYNLIIIVLVVIFFVWLFNTFNNKNTTTTTINNTPISVTPGTHIGKNTLYPDSKLTPGDIFTTATKEQICTSGYSKTVRDVPVETKQRVYEEYGISYPQPQGSYEVDHFISLELGGSNDIKNLWPEPSEPKPGFHEKDAVENYLHEQLCSGNETLDQVQNEIRTDWYAVYLKISKS